MIAPAKINKAVGYPGVYGAVIIIIGLKFFAGVTATAQAACQDCDCKYF
jgi:hypothetical protein